MTSDALSMHHPRTAKSEATHIKVYDIYYELLNSDSEGISFLDFFCYFLYSEHYYYIISLDVLQSRTTERCGGYRII